MTDFLTSASEHLDQEVHDRAFLQPDQAEIQTNILIPEQVE